MSQVGKFISGAGRILTGYATGGVVGAITQWAGGGGGRGGTPPASPIFGGGGGGLNMPFPVKGPGGQPLPGYNPGGQPGGQCPRGYHLNKHALSASKRHGAVPARTICVRNRKMNPMNPRAITRALRREKRARKIIRRLHAFAPVRHQAGHALAKRK